MGPGSMDEEASKPPVSSSTDDGSERIEARFAHLCKVLFLLFSLICLFSFLVFFPSFLCVCDLRL